MARRPGDRWLAQVRRRRWEPGDNAVNPCRVVLLYRTYERTVESGQLPRDRIADVPQAWERAALGDEGVQTATARDPTYSAPASGHAWRQRGGQRLLRGQRQSQGCGVQECAVGGCLPPPQRRAVLAFAQLDQLDRAVGSAPL